MANEKEDQETFTLRIDIVEQPEGALAAYAFDATGGLLARAPVDDGEALLAVSPKRALAGRVFVGPELPDDLGRPTPAMMERIGAYEPALRPEKPGAPYARVQLPPDFLDRWRLCFCLVRGRVVKGGRPVCGARVHICEVDRWPRFVFRLPDLEVLRLRDDLLRALAEQPPFRDPIPIPDPPPFLDRLRSPLRLGGIGDPGAEVGFNPQPEPPASRVALNPQPLPPKAVQALVRQVARTSVSLPAEALAALASPSASVVRRGLADQARIVLPYLCWWPWWRWRYRCDEVRVVQTNAAGRFSTLLLYPCSGDKPDLYFWVEYEIGGTWQTVYRPPLACNTYWDYPCGTEVTIHVTDPRVPACDDEPDLVGLQVAVMSIGNNVSVSEVQGAGAGEGLTTAGEPFGGSLEPHVWFSREALIAAGVTHYRWSFRRLTGPDGTTPDVDPSWTSLSHHVGRHYSVIGPTGDLSFPFETLGPDGSGLFRIKPPDPPAPGIDWIVLDAREDTATAFFETTALPHGITDPNPTECEQAEAAAGTYELKLELFRSSGDRVDDWDAEGIALKVASSPAPFGAATASTVDATPYHRLMKSGHTAGFRMVVRVDNSCCHADVHPIGGSGLSIDANCGFVEYAPGATVNVRFDAGHPQDFATFSFRTQRGASTGVPEASTSGGVGAASTPTGASPTSAPPAPGPFSRTGDTFSKGLPVDTLLSANTPSGATPCSRAAFAQTLYVAALATDGWGRLHHLDRDDVAAFVLATPCDCDE